MKKNLFLSIIFCFMISFAQEEQAADTISEETTAIETAQKETTDEIAETKETEIQNADNDTINAQEDTVKEEEIDDETSLTIITTPDSATILINRKKSGFTPFSASELEPQEYNIMLLKDGYELFDTTINLEYGQKDTILINLVSENKKGENVEVKSEASSKTRKTANTKKEESDEEETETEITEEKKKKMDRIGIIVFLSVMLILMGMQEAGSR